MRTRTLLTLLATTLLLPMGALAQDASAPADAPASDRPAQDRPTIRLELAPAQARVVPGGNVTYTLVAHARADLALTLEIRTPDDIFATLSSDTLKVPAGTGARTTITVASTTATQAGQHVIHITAKSPDGAFAQARAMLYVQTPGDAREPPTRDMPPQRDGPARDAATDRDTRPQRDGTAFAYRVEILEHRLQALAARVERIERGFAQPNDRPEPAASGARMTLAQERTIVDPHGGRVALLLQGGDHDARVHLAARYNGSSGWNVGLEKEIVPVKAHERTWVWVHFAPARTCPPAADAANADDAACTPAPHVAFSIAQVGTPVPYTVKGMAVLAREPPTAEPTPSSMP